MMYKLHVYVENCKTCYKSLTMLVFFSQRTKMLSNTRSGLLVIPVIVLCAVPLPLAKVFD